MVCCCCSGTIYEQVPELVKEAVERAMRVSVEGYYHFIEPLETRRAEIREQFAARKAEMGVQLEARKAKLRAQLEARKIEMQANREALRVQWQEKHAGNAQ